MLSLPNLFAQLSQTNYIQHGTQYHEQMTPYRKIVQPNESTIENAKKSAVNVMLFSSTELQVLLIKRTDYNGIHSGQISFPGGKVEPTDFNMQYTAIRETEEEVGILKQQLSPQLPLTPLYIPPSNFYVYPFLCYNTTPLNNFKLQHTEVAEVILLPVKLLLSNEIYSEKNIQTSFGVIKNCPCYIYHSHTIWGATAAILNEVKHTLQPLLV